MEELKEGRGKSELVSRCKSDRVKAIRQEREAHPGPHETKSQPHLKTLKEYQTIRALEVRSGP